MDPQMGTFCREAFGGERIAAVAVENDYNLLVFTLNDLAATFTALRDDIEQRLLREKHVLVDEAELDYRSLLA